MGHGHSHGGPPPKIEIGQQARNLLVSFLVLIGTLAAFGLIWLWPTNQEISNAIAPVTPVEGLTYHKARIDKIVNECPDIDTGGQPCQDIDATITSGEHKDQQVSLRSQGGQANLNLRVGDVIEVVAMPSAHSDDRLEASMSGVDRTPVLVSLLVLFLVCVFAVARLRGFMALVGLVVAGFLLLRFMLPAIIVGKPGMAVALAGSTAIMFIVLYVAHGISLRTSAALAGTLLGLGLTTGLGALAVSAARLSGYVEENDYYLSQLAPAINFQDLFMVALIVGGLGVLNDVTITQASAVWELRAAAPGWSRRQVFASGMRIGRDHIASTIYTIVFAYAGSALTILLLLYFSARNSVSMFNIELFSGEIIRTLGSAIGLILSVPITTGIAALTVGPARSERDTQAALWGKPTLKNPDLDSASTA